MVANSILLGLILTLGLMLIGYAVFSRDPINLRQAAAARRKKAATTIKPPGSFQIKDLLADSRNRFQIFWAIVLAVVFYFGTGWPVASLFGLVVGWAMPDLLNNFTAGRRYVAEIEAWSVWTEQLLHLVVSGNALPNSVVASANYAPALIRQEVEPFAADTENLGFREALDNLIARTKSPYVDRIASGMIISYEAGARIRESFQELLDSIRAEAEVAKRAEAARRVASSQGLLSISVAFGLLGLIIILNRGYLEPFDNAAGQGVLFLVAAILSFAIITIRSFSVITPKKRLFGKEEDSKLNGRSVKNTKKTNSRKTEPKQEFFRQ